MSGLGTAAAAPTCDKTGQCCGIAWGTLGTTGLTGFRHRATPAPLRPITRAASGVLSRLRRAVKDSHAGRAGMIWAITVVRACQLLHSGRRAMLHADIVVAFCDNHSIERQWGVSWASGSSSSLW